MKLADLARRWFRTPSPSVAVRRSPARRPRPGLERLEARDVPATVSVHFFLDGNSDGVWTGSEARSTGQFTAVNNITGASSSSSPNPDGVASATGLEAGMYNLSITPAAVSGWVYNGPTNLLVSLDTATSVVALTAGLVPAPGGGGRDRGDISLIDGDGTGGTGTGGTGTGGTGTGGTGTATGSIGDRVWSDEDRDGVQDEGEAGVPGAGVELLDGQGNWRAWTSTGADGHYSFGGLAAGGYQVRVTAPAGFAAGGTASVTLAAGQQITGADVGLFPDGEEETGTGVRGRMWLDDGDGVRQDGEPGVPGTVTLSDGDGMAWAKRTDGDGAYSFDGLAAGGYLVTFEPYRLGGEGGWDGGFAPAGQGDDRLRDSDVEPWGASVSLYGTGYAQIDAGVVPPPVAAGAEYSVLPSAPTTVDAWRGVLANDDGPAVGLTAGLV
ncbi:MAG: SdrD B-like domain-containing protein, partial [Gemmataceae bacterium]